MNKQCIVAFLVWCGMTNLSQATEDWRNVQALDAKLSELNVEVTENRGNLQSLCKEVEIPLSDVTGPMLEGWKSENGNRQKYLIDIIKGFSSLRLYPKSLVSAYMFRKNYSTFSLPEENLFQSEQNRVELLYTAWLFEEKEYSPLKTPTKPIWNETRLEWNHNRNSVKENFLKKILPDELFQRAFDTTLTTEIK